MVDCWKFWSLHNMHSSENMRGWQLVYEADSYSLCWHCAIYIYTHTHTHAHAHKQTHTHTHKQTNKNFSIKNNLLSFLLVQVLWGSWPFHVRTGWHNLENFFQFTLTLHETARVLQHRFCWVCPSFSQYCWKKQIFFPTVINRLFRIAFSFRLHF
jgi:hypothetical protein